MPNASAYHVLLSRLAHAITAGCMLAGPSGCDGAAQDDTADSRSANLGADDDTGADGDGTDGAGETAGEGASDGLTAGQGDRVGSEHGAGDDDPGNDGAMETPTGPGVSTSEFEPPPEGGGFWKESESGTSTTTEPPTMTVEEPSEEPPVTRVDAGTDAGSAMTLASDGGESTTDPGELMCEYGGQPVRFCVNRDSMVQQARYGTGQIPLDPPRSDEEVEGGFDENGCMKQEWVATSCCNPALRAGEPQADGTCCYVACEGACCGRPLVSAGEAIIAGLTTNSSWNGKGSALLADATEAERQALAERWLVDGLMEHASVASFSCFTLDLMALGAPPELLADAQQAGLDEVKHAQGCFNIASRLHASNSGPGPLELKTWTVRDAVTAVQAAIHEGCVGEVLAAGIAREQARRCTHPEIRAHLDTIVQDETRHAELAWRFVAWAIERFGQPLKSAATQAFSSALRELPASPYQTEGLSAELLHAAGRLTAEEWRAAAESVRELVLKPAAAELLSESAGGAARRVMLTASAAS